MSAAVAMYPSVPVILLDQVTAIGASGFFGLPAKSAVYLCWQTAFDVNPDAVNITIRVSLDGVVWTVIDTSTAVGGEVRTIAAPTAATFVDANVVTNTGGHKITVTLVAETF